MSAPLQLTIASGGAPAPQPGPGVDPDGSSEPVEGAFGTGTGGPTSASPGQPVAEPDLPPFRVSFGPGPASGASTPNGTASTSPRSGTAGSSTGPGKGGSSGSGGETGDNPSTDSPGSNPTGGPSNPRRGRTGRPPRGPGGPSSGPSTATTGTSRPGRITNLLRLGLATATRSPTGRTAARPSRAPRTGRVDGRPLLGGLGSLLASWGSALGRLLRSGRARASRFTTETWRVIAILLVGVIVALGGHIDLGAPDPAQTTAAAPAGATTTARRVLDLADSQVGTTESRGGGTPYHRDYGIAPDQPWCAVFVWDMFREAGASDLIGPKTAYTPTLAGWFRQRGQWSSTPTVGALVFYDWPGDSKSRIQHVGIVEAIGPNTIQTIEANTSSGVAGSQANGGGVWRRTRPRNDAIVGYGLPSYALAA